MYTEYKKRIEYAMVETILFPTLLHSSMNKYVYRPLASVPTSYNTEYA